MSHTCHAAGCARVCPPRFLMCPFHWRMVPARTQSLVWQHYRPGQEIDKRPTLEYLAVQQTAVGEVAAKEGLTLEADQAFRNASRFRQLAKEAKEKAKST